MQMKRADLTGHTFGRLTALAYAPQKGPKGRIRSAWKCQCACGQIIYALTETLVGRKTSSCGCLRTEMLISRSLTHGATIGRRPTREYKSWQHAKARCHTPTDHKYRIYGARGITMSDQWRKSFSAFLADMGECPPGKTLDRINTNGNYCKQNCRWATRIEQGSNRRDNIIIHRPSGDVTLKELSREYQCNYGSLWDAVKRRGEDPLKAAVRLAGL